MKKLFLGFALFFAFLTQGWGDACDDYNTLLGYGIIGSSGFSSGQNSTINGMGITGSIANPTTPTPTGNLASVHPNFQPINPSTFPTFSSTTDLTNQPTISAGTYRNISTTGKIGSMSVFSIFSGGTYNIKKLTIGSNGSDNYVVLAPGDYFIEELEMFNGAEIRLSGDGAVKIYIKTSFTGGNEIKLNSGGNVANFKIYLYSGATVNIGSYNSGDSTLSFNGMIYSHYSNTTINFGNNNNIQGAILSAGTVNVGNKTTFLYSSDVQTALAGSLGCVTPKLLLNYRFDECSWNGTTGEVGDMSGNNLNGTAKNNALSAFDGKICKFGFFDSKSYIEVPNNLKLEFKDSFSITAWIKTSKATGTIVSKTDVSSPWKGFVFAIGPDSGGKLSFWNGSAWSTSNGAAVNDNRWHHVAMTVSGKTLNFYVDGTQNGSTITMSQAMSAASSNPLRIGLENNTNTIAQDRYFSGSIDELKIFTGSLSSSQILDIYTNENNLKNYDGTQRTCGNCRTGPSLKWTFSECTPGQNITSVKDYSGANNDGVVTGTIKCVNYPKNTDDNKGALFTQSGGRQYVTSNKNLSFNYQSGYTVITRFKFEDTPYRSWLMYFGYNGSQCNNNGMHWLINSHPETPQCENRLSDSVTQVGVFCGPQNQFNLKPFEGTEEINATTVYYKNYVGDNGQNPRRLRTYINGKLANEYNLSVSQADPTSGNAPVYLAKQWDMCSKESDFKGVVDHLEIYPYAIDYENKCLALSSSFSPTNVGLNEGSEYNLYIKNNCSVAINDVSINLSWPPNLTLSNGPNIESGGWDILGGGSGNWYGLTFGANSTIKFSAKFKSSVAGEYPVTATPTQSTPTTAKLNVSAVSFDAWEVSQGNTKPDTPRLYTKVAPAAFSFMIGGPNNYTGTVCARIVDNTGNQVADYLCNNFDDERSKSFGTWSVSSANKVLKVEIRSTSTKNKTKNDITTDWTSSTSSDSFAIRPASFTPNPSSLVAKNNEKLTLAASPLSGVNGALPIKTRIAGSNLTCDTTVGFFNNEPIDFTFTNGISNEVTIPKITDIGAIKVYNSSWTNVDQPADCIVGSGSNSLSADGKYGCDIEGDLTINPYKFVTTATVEPSAKWRYMANEFDKNITIKSSVEAKNEDGAAAQNFDKACAASDVGGNMSYTKEGSLKYAVNLAKNPVNDDFAVLGDSLALTYSKDLFSKGKYTDMNITLITERDYKTFKEPITLKDTKINTISSAVNIQADIGTLSFLYGRLAMPNAIVDYAPSVTVRAYAEVYAKDASKLPSGATWVQAPGSSEWWINTLDNSSAIASLYLRKNDILTQLQNEVGSVSIGSISNGVFSLTLSELENKDQKIRAHLNTPSYLWYGSNAYNFSQNSKCAEHPCAIIDIYKTETDKDWYGSGDTGNKTIQTVPKGKRAPKVNW